MKLINPVIHQSHNSSAGAVDNFSHVNQLQRHIAKIYVCTAPKIGRILAQTSRSIHANLAGGIHSIESRLLLLKKNDPAHQTAALRRQRFKAIQCLSTLSLVTDIGALAGATASLFAPPAAFAALAFSLVTFSLRRATKALCILALNTAQEPFKEKTAPKIQDYIDVVDLMKSSGVKYIATSRGLKTRTDLCLDAYVGAQRQLINGAVAQRHQHEVHIQGIEARLRSILAGKAKHRDTKAVFGLMPIIAHHRVSAHYVQQGFGTTTALIPLEPDPRHPERISVIGQLKSKAYSSQTQRPALEYSLRNIAWESGHQKDWANLIIARQSLPEPQAQLSTDGQRLLKSYGFTDANVKVQQLLTDSVYTIAEQALESLTPADVEKVNQCKINEMSSSGQGILYIIQKLIREPYEAQWKTSARAAQDVSFFKNKVESIGAFTVNEIKNELHQLKSEYC